MSNCSSFNCHLADAFCTALTLGHEDEAMIFLSLPSFPHHLLIEKFATAILENDITLMNELHKTQLIDMNGICRNGETLLTLALKNRMAYTGKDHIIPDQQEENTRTVTLETINALLSYPELDASVKNQRNQAPIILAVTPSDSRVFLTMITRPDIDVNAANHWGKTLLMELVDYEGSAAVQMLESTLARPELDKNAKTDTGITAAMLIGQNNDFNMVSTFLSSGGIELHHVAQYGITALSSSVGKPNNYNAIANAMK